MPGSTLHCKFDMYIYFYFFPYYTKNTLSHGHRECAPVTDIHFFPLKTISFREMDLSLPAAFL